MFLFLFIFSPHYCMHLSASVLWHGWHLSLGLLSVEQSSPGCLELWNGCSIPANEENNPVFLTLLTLPFARCCVCLHYVGFYSFWAGYGVVSKGTASGCILSLCFFSPLVFCKHFELWRSEGDISGSLIKMSARKNASSCKSFLFSSHFFIVVVSETDTDTNSTPQSFLKFSCIVIFFTPPNIGYLTHQNDPIPWLPFIPNTANGELNDAKSCFLSLSHLSIPLFLSFLPTLLFLL